MQHVLMSFFAFLVYWFIISIRHSISNNKVCAGRPLNNRDPLTLVRLYDLPSRKAISRRFAADTQSSSPRRVKLVNRGAVESDVYNCIVGAQVCSVDVGLVLLRCINDWNTIVPAHQLLFHSFELRCWRSLSLLDRYFTEKCLLKR